MNCSVIIDHSSPDGIETNEHRDLKILRRG